MPRLGGLREAFAAAVRDRERAGLLAAYLLLYVVTDASQQVVPLYYQAVGVSVGALGVAKSAGNLLEAVASTPVGVLADSADRASIVLVAGGALAVVLAAFPFASSALALGALVVAYALARLAFSVAATPLLSASFDDGSEGVGWAVRDTAIYCGGALGIAGAGVVVAEFADVWPVFVALVPAVLALVAVVAYTHRPTFALDVSPRSLVADWPPRPLASFRATSRPRVLARFLAVDFLGGLGMGMCFYRRSRPSASGLDPEGEGRELRWVFHFHCGWLAFKIIALLHWYWSE
ncbi:MAG: MFS transporter [Halobacterium sp.]